jgi:cardiolipin synthase
MHLAHVIVSHLLSIASFVLALVLVARAAEQRRPTGSTIAWLLAILLIPYVGIPLFLLIGNRKIQKRAATKCRLGPSRVAPSDLPPLARMLCTSGASSPTQRNRLDLLTSGEASFEAVIRAIESAERTIHVSTLILADDASGRAIASRLADKAKHGVTVRLMIDALFEFRSSRAQIGALRAAGVHVAWFMPAFSLSRKGHANLRLHRKAIVVDDRLAIVGGMNLAEEYMGPTPMPSRWRDLSATLTGPAVADVVEIFRADWAFAAGEQLEAPSAPEASGDVSLQVVGSGPDVESDLIYDAILTSVFAAKRRLWIATPYFVPDDALARALALAVRRGVDVCVIVPLRSNHRTADLAGASYLRDLETVGGRVRRYAPGMMHAKVVVVDDDLAILGSANMDMRSFFLDYELAFFVTTPSEVLAMASWFSDVLPQCVDAPQQGRVRRLVEAAARLLAPLE